MTYIYIKINIFYVILEEYNVCMHTSRRSYDIFSWSSHFNFNFNFKRECGKARSEIADLITGVIHNWNHRSYVHFDSGLIYRYCAFHYCFGSSRNKDFTNAILRNSQWIHAWFVPLQYENSTGAARCYGDIGNVTGCSPRCQLKKISRMTDELWIPKRIVYGTYIDGRFD
jgi:hypothetical protein